MTHIGMLSANQILAVMDGLTASPPIYHQWPIDSVKDTQRIKEVVVYNEQCIPKTEQSWKELKGERDRA